MRADITTASQPAVDFERAVRFIVARGAAGPVHNSDVTLLEHVLGTYRVLERWNCDGPACVAGLFHSIYSTQNFPIALASYDERDIVRRVTGARAERLAFLFCVKDSNSLFDAAEEVLRLRETGSKAESDPGLTLRDWRDASMHAVTPAEVGNLVALVAANALEQSPRSTRTLERDLPSLTRVERLLPRDVYASLRSFVAVPA